MHTTTTTRRRVLELTGVAAAAALAGCSGGSDGGGGGDDSDGGTDSQDGSDGSADGGEAGSAAEFDGWFDNVSNFDGVVDETDQTEVAVDVGTGPDGFLFDPPAVRVSTDTTVTWEWTGEGGAHNVVAADGSFESDLQTEAGATFEHTFETAGTYRYYCDPHETMGMKGAVVVE